eukprot:14746467-Alexandrium_andersonii.AAC.1
MSASLVGSEMCIRDRRSRPWTSGRRSTPWARLSWRERWSARASPWTVSYTHLTLPTICSV